MNRFSIQVARVAAFFITSSAATIAAERQPAKTLPTPPNASALFGDKVIAKGKGVEVKQSQIDEMYITFKANRSAMGLGLPAARAKIEADILEKLIATQLFVSMATEADKAKGKEIANTFIAEQIKQTPSEESFNRQLRSLGMEPDLFRAQILEQAVVKAVIDRELRPKINVTDAQVKEYYDKNATRYQEPELVRVRHVLISTKDPATGQELPPDKRVEKQKLAQKVLTRARAGEDFTWLAKEFSEDNASKTKGGEYVIARAKDDPNRAVVPEFEGAAFSLGTNQVSDIVTTKYGFHVIKVVEKIPVKQIEFAKVEAAIKEELIQEQIQSQLPEFVAKLKKDADVAILTTPQKP
jgi:peptidyl-prolyl cis-trans isomerase C